MKNARYELVLFELLPMLSSTHVSIKDQRSCRYSCLHEMGSVITYERP